MRSLNQESADFRKANVEAFFAAVGVLSDKEAIVKMLLLEAKSGHELSPENKRSIAQRVVDHSNASDAIRAEAKNILSGEKACAIGKPLEISFTADDGRKVNLAEMKVKVVLIDFRFGINSVPTQWLVDKKGILRETNSRFNLEQE